MKITSIKLQKTFNLGNYENEKIEIDGELKEGEDVMQAIDEARKIAEANFKQKYPHLIQFQFQEPDIPIMSLVKKEPEHPKTPEERTIQQINEIKDLTVLKSFELLASRNEKIKSAYDNRLKQLTA